MIFWLIDLITVVVTACTGALLIRGAFRLVDSTIRDEARKAIYSSTGQSSFRKSVLVPANELMDALWGSRLFSVRSFLLSSALSIFIQFTFASLFRKTWTGADYEGISSFLIAIPTISVVLNMLPDCLVLIKSRVILKTASKVANPRQQLELITCDVISSLTIKWSGLLLIGYVLVILIGGESPHEVHIWLKQTVLDIPNGGKAFVGFVFFCISSLSMPIWALLCGLSICLIEVVGKDSRGSRWTNSKGVHGYPIRLFGDVAAALVATILVGIGGLASVFPVI